MNSKQPETVTEPERSAGSTPAPCSPKLVLIPMGYDEAVAMLDNLTRLWPHPIPHNVQYKQWDLMLPNLEALERHVQKAKRILAAISENAKLTDGAGTNL